MGIVGTVVGGGRDVGGGKVGRVTVVGGNGVVVCHWGETGK